MLPESRDGYLFHLVDLTAGAARRRFRQSIKDAWGCCAYCGRSHDEDSGEPLHMTLDHVRPRSNGGSTLRSNLVPACRRCNAEKGSVLQWRTWYATQPFYCPVREQRILAWLQPDGETVQSLRPSPSRKNNAGIEPGTGILPATA